MTAWKLGFAEEGVSYPLDSEWLDGESHKITYIDTTLDVPSAHGRFKKGTWGAGRAIHPEGVPTKLRHNRGASKGKPDALWSGGGHFVNEKVKDIFESFEPGVHQFFPVECVWKDGAPAEPMYFMIICNRIDSLAQSMSIGRMTILGWYATEAREVKIVLDEQRFAGCHAWVERQVGFPTTNPFYISDALHSALRAADVTGLVSWPIDTVEGAE